MSIFVSILHQNKDISQLAFPWRGRNPSKRIGYFRFEMVVMMVPPLPTCTVPILCSYARVPFLKGNTHVFL